MKRFGWGLFLALAGLPFSAMADEFNDGLQTLWEVLWHQSGTPTRIVRWESDLKVRVWGVNVAARREYTLEALRAAASEAGLKLTDVTGTPEEASANVSVEILADNALEDNQPCVTFLDFTTETRIDAASVQMRDRAAWRCAYHESMHVMGVRGHPGGATVLSYFPTRVDTLMPLDKVMLRAWYSPRMAGGMTPFESLPILTDELVATLPPNDRPVATQSRDAFFARIIDKMQSYASGQGDIPAIVTRSG